MEEQKKLCKYCKTEIPKNAKICPNCKKKQGGLAKWIAILVIVVIIIIAIASGDDKDSNPQKVGENDETTSSVDTEETENNVFHVGDIVETENMRITYISSELYQSDNEFITPKDGYVFWKFEFKFENISSTDQSISTMLNWTCYADNAKADQTWVTEDNGLDATLSPNRETQGTIYFEVPENAENIELEYDIDFYKNNKIIFVAK